MTINYLERFKKEDMEEMFVYLDELKESSVTNMILAWSYLQKEFEITRSESKAVLGEWMDTYEKRHKE